MEDEVGMSSIALMFGVWAMTLGAEAQSPSGSTAPTLPDIDQVVAAFEAADRACNGGKGCSDSADSGTLGWGESSWLRNYWEMYELTGQRRWWDKIIDHFNRMIAHMTDHDGDGFKSWQTTTYSVALIRAEALHNRGTATIDVKRAKLFDIKQAHQVTGHRYLIEFADGKTYIIRDATVSKVLSPRAAYESGKPVTVAPQITVTITGGPIQGDTFGIWTTAPGAVEYVVHQGMVLTSVARLIEAALKRPADDPYHKKALESLGVIERHFLEGNEKYWIDTGDGAGAYRFTPDPTERYPNRILPHNQYLALARTWLILADATGKEPYRRRATAMARNFKRALRIVDGAYEWNYWDWIEDGKPGHSGVEDSSHGSIDVGFVVEAARRGVVFDANDTRRLAKTLLDRMWNRSTTDPRFGSHVNTARGDALPVKEWVGLCQWDPKVLDVIATAVMKRCGNADRAVLLPAVLAAKRRMVSTK
jgi:hypothetical protein